MALERDKHTAQRALLTLQETQLLELYRRMVLIRQFEEKTAEMYARGKITGFCHLYAGEEAVAVGEAVMTVQRDWGDRSDRKHARLKYTVEDRWLNAFRVEVERRSGVRLGKPRRFAFDSSGDRYGWSEGANGRAHLTLFIENGRVKDLPPAAICTGLEKVTLCQPEAVSLLNVADASRVPLEFHRWATFVPVIARCL